MEGTQAAKTAAERRAVLPAAQTNLRLYRQLHEAGYAPTDLLLVRDGYELATALFAGQFRGSGKPFVAHLVGTASILAAVEAPPAVVVAGLLHAVYAQGDFGIARWRERRARVRAAVGDAVERLVWRYEEMPWTPAAIERFRADPAVLAGIDRQVALMRLANELDDNLDLAMLHSHAAKDAFHDCRDAIAALAHALVGPRLADAFLATYAEEGDGAWALPLSLGRPASYQLASSFGLGLLRPAKRARRIAERLAKKAGL
jgi:(p)ppGpp synthase/HD superfamily hydrolase